MALTQKSAIGLDRLYYAVMTSDEASGVPVYGTIYRLLGAKALSFNGAAALTTNYADDTAFELMESMGDKALTLSIVDLLPEDEARILGYSYAAGVTARASTASSPYIAILGRTLLSDGSYGYFRYYKLKFGKPNYEDATRESSPSPRMITLEGRVADLISTTYPARFMERARNDDTTVAATVLTNWFTTISFQSANLAALTVTAAAGAAGLIVFTFAKTGGGAVNLNQDTVNNTNIIISIDSTNAIASPTAWTFGAGGGATQTATAEGLTSVKHDFVVTRFVTDFNGVGATVKAGSVTVA